MIESPVFAGLPWLAHGFGTRNDQWSARNAAQLKQIHSNTVWAVTEAGVAGEGDALITATPELELAIRTADCYPVLLADPKRRAVAAIHAGWRGTGGRIVPKAIEKMHALFGTEPGDVAAAIGPGIGACCYQVGDEVARQFDRAHISHGRCLDLAAANRQQLVEAGVEPNHIWVSGACTFCNAQNFFSFRREKEQAGRMTSYVRLLAGD